MTCSNNANCPLFAQFAMEPSLKLWKQHFCEGEYTKCVRYQYALEGKPVPITLLRNGKMLNQKVRDKEELGGTALFNAIYKGRVPMVRSMIKTKVSDTAIVGPDGMTPLMAAASIGNLELTNLFLEFGCNPYNRRNDEKRAVDIARQGGFSDCADAIQGYMDQHPEKQAEASTLTAQVSSEVAETDEKEEMKNVVSFLRKLNPFKK
jgi:hypothetical protein